MSIFANTLETIEAAAKENARHADDYVGEDGLLYCAKCNTRRQMPLNIPLPGYGMRIVPVLCKCDVERRDAEEAMRRAYEEQERIKRLRHMGITDAAYMGMTLDADDGLDKKMGNVVRKYIDNRNEVEADNIGLLLHGDTDGGKTFWAAAIANAMIDNGMSAMVTTIPDLVKAMHANYEENKQQVLNQIRNVRFLILDDIGFERRTPYASEKMYEIINARYLAKKPLIVTTNLTLEQIKNPSDMDYKRVFSRIIEMTTPIHVAGMERRQKIAREKSAALRDMLTRPAWELPEEV